MDPGRQERVAAIVGEALARAGEARAAYLETACAGDSDVRREVDSLLRGADAGPGLLEPLGWTSAGEALTPGTRLGPYEIQSTIGTGGMGEVYRATDTRLGRTVAIKVLPPDLANDPERRRRFEQEARAASALDHPNICTLYDIGDAVPADPRSQVIGPGASSVSYLVLEYLDGDTLAERLKNGPLPLAHALDVGAQIAEALGAAHRLGIVHRDLKPANVMLTKAGAPHRSAVHVKLLDFGLAKLRAYGEQPLVASPAAGPSALGPLTARGEILGTWPYMAPEQVEGKAADARTDIWALGAVLYETLTGARAFVGDSAASMVGAILQREPEPLTSRRQETPSALDRLVRKCLAKDPDARWQNVRDVAAELQWIAEDLSGRGSTGARTQEATSHTRRPRWGVLLVLIAVAVASAAVTWGVVGRREDPDVRYRLIDTRPADGLQVGNPWDRNFRIAFGRPSRTSFHLTPDGRRLVFAGTAGGRQQLFVKDLFAPEAAASAARPIPETEGADEPFLSPDARMVGFHLGDGQSRQGKLMRVAIDGGGPPVPLCEAAMPFGASWGDDGTVVFAPLETSGLWRVSSNGGSPQPVTTPVEDSGHRLPYILPGSRAVLFTVTGPGGGTAVHRFGAGASEWQLLIPGGSDARYVPTGHLLYLRDGQLMAVRFDIGRLTVVGEHTGVVSNVMHASGAANPMLGSLAGQYSVSDTGTLAYVPGGPYPEREKQLAWVDRNGRLEPMTAPVRAYMAPRVAADERLVAVSVGNGVFVHDTKSPGSLIRINRDADAAGFPPLWFPSSSRDIIFQGPSGNGVGLFRLPIDPPLQAAEPLTSESGLLGLFPASWSPNGDLIVIKWFRNQRQHVWRYSFGDGRLSGKALLDMAPLVQYAQVSPDGRWLAYVSDESGRQEVYIRRFPGLTGARQVSTQRGVSPVWSRDGRELFYLRGSIPANLELVVHRVGPEGVSPDARVLFSQGSIRTVSAVPVAGFDVAPSGRFVFAVFPDRPPPPPPREIHLVENWFEELKAKVTRQ